MLLACGLTQPAAEADRCADHGQAPESETGHLAGLESRQMADR
jgi:hypothetical protein